MNHNNVNHTVLVVKPSPSGCARVVFAKYTTAREAEAVVDRLVALGVDAYVVTARATDVPGVARRR